MAWLETDWRYVTSEGVETTVGPSWQVGSGGGAYYVENTRTRNQLQLTYVYAGGGLGRGLPISVDMSFQDLRSGGIGRIYGIDRSRLAPDDFGGLCFIVNVQGSLAVSIAGFPTVPHPRAERRFLGGGAALSLVFFGLPWYTLAALTGVGLIVLSAIGVDAKAVGAMWSTNMGMQRGVAAMAYGGYITALG